MLTQDTDHASIGRRGQLLWTTLLACQVLVTPAAAQDSSGMHATLRGWADEAWLTILDRNGATDGRLGELGILQRFHEIVDDKYYMDQLTTGFNLAEDYDWYSRDDGVRWRTGSITKRIMIMRGEFKTKVPLGPRWRLGVRFDKVNMLEARRSPVRLEVSRKLGAGLTAVGEAHFDFDKPDSDFGLGIDWHGSHGTELTFTVTVLDAVNDLVFLNFDAASQPGTDSTLEYRRQPIIARLSLDHPFSAAVRIEGYAAYLRPSTILAYEGQDTSAGFQQDERFGYAGGLIEWSVGRDATLAGFATTIWARSDRTRLSPAAPVNPYRLTEQTTQLGAFGVAQLSTRWRVDGWALHTWRPERRVSLDGSQPDVDFLVRSLHAQALLTYRARSGFTADAGIGLNRARTPRGVGQVPAEGTLEATHVRFRYDIGWRSGERAQFMIGSASDINASGDLSFGGARGRLILLW